MKLDVFRQIKFRLASDIYPAALLSHVSKVIKFVIPLAGQADPLKPSGADVMTSAAGSRSFMVLAVIIFLCGVLTGCLFLLFLTG